MFLQDGIFSRKTCNNVISNNHLVFYIIKITIYFDTCKKEYSNVIPASLYAGFPMIMMLLGSYYFDYNQLLGKGLWAAGLIIDAVHILIFTYRNVIKGVKLDTFVPSWFVTYNGILVSAVIGIPMKEPFICKIYCNIWNSSFCCNNSFYGMASYKKSQWMDQCCIRELL